MRLYELATIWCRIDRRPRLLRGGFVFALCGFLIGAPAFAQLPSPPGSQPPRGAAPVMPVELPRPTFDTKTRVYDPIAGKKASDMAVAEVEGRKITLADVKDFIAALPP